MKKIVTHKKCEIHECSGEMKNLGRGISNSQGTFWAHECDKCGYQRSRFKTGSEMTDDTFKPTTEFKAPTPVIKIDFQIYGRDSHPFSNAVSFTIQEDGKYVVGSIRTKDAETVSSVLIFDYTGKVVGDENE